MLAVLALLWLLASAYPAYLLLLTGKIPLELEVMLVSFGVYCAWIVIMTPMQWMFAWFVMPMYFFGVLLTALTTSAWPLILFPVLFGIATIFLVVKAGLAVKAIPRRLTRLTATVAGIVSAGLALHIVGEATLQLSLRRVVQSGPYDLHRTGSVGLNVIELQRSVGLGGPGDSPYSRFRADLLTEDRCYRWSYTGGGFVPYADSLAGTPCDGVPLDLGFDLMKTRPDGKTIELLWNGARYRLPVEADPFVRGDYLGFDMTSGGLDFEAAGGTVHVSAARAEGVQLKMLNIDRDGYTAVGAFGSLTEYRADKGWPNSRFFGRHQGRGTETWIGCHGVSGARPSCQHRFIEDGIAYTFRHPLRTLESIDDLQRHVVRSLAASRVRYPANVDNASRETHSEA